MKQDREMTKMRRTRIQMLLRERLFTIYRRIIVFFLVFIVASCLLSLLPKDKSFSETENRMLAQKPEFSIANLTSGRYMSDMEDYITDQFYLRNQWISLKMKQDLFLGKRESNGVYIGKKGHLLEIPDEPDTEAVNKSIESISGFAQRHRELTHVMTLVPNAVSVCNQYLPNFAPVRNQAEDIAMVSNGVGEDVHFIDLSEKLQSHKEEALYYKTDHHWTSLGAKYAFEELAEPLGIRHYSSNFDVYPVTDCFKGTLSSKSGYMKSSDVVEIYAYSNENIDCLVTYTEEQKKSASIYDSTALEQKDKYEVFFGGNHARVDILVPKSEGGNLLIFKDSYANCFVQFLLPYFKNIIMIDPRYYYDDIEKIIADKEITDVLYLYNVNTFMRDNSLADVLAEQEIESAPVEESESQETEDSVEMPEE